MYADKITNSMRNAIDETDRRRAIQVTYNEEHGITPLSVRREVTKSITSLQQAISQASKGKKKDDKVLTEPELQKKLADLEYEMRKAAEDLDFEKAIALREQWLELQKTKKR